MTTSLSTLTSMRNAIWGTSSTESILLKTRTDISWSATTDGSRTLDTMSLKSLKLEQENFSNEVTWSEQNVHTIIFMLILFKHYSFIHDYITWGFGVLG